MIAQLVKQPDCSRDEGSWCARIYQITHNDLLSRYADTVVGAALHIVLIIVLAVLAKWPSIMTIGPLHKLRPTPLPSDAIIPVITTNPSVVVSSGEINQAIAASQEKPS